MSTYDNRWDEAESDVDKARQWRNGADGGPNPLTIEATEWVGPIDTEYGPVELLLGRDRSGSLWSVMTGGRILGKALIEGVVEDWDDEKKAFVQTNVLGKVEVGEIVSIKFNGKRDGGKFSYNDYSVSRKPAREGGEEQNLGSAPVAAATDDDIPFDDGVPD